MPGRGQTFFIAEAGVNHNGSLALALRLVEEAARAGADAVKFQTFTADSLVTAGARKAAYQEATTGADENQLQMLRRLELREADWRALAAKCREVGIAFMSTAFDFDSLRFLTGFDMPAMKIPSGDLTAAPLVLETARTGRPIILSTGMATLEEIRETLGVIAFGLTRKEEPTGERFRAAFDSSEGRAALERTVTLLHCVTAYPAPVDSVNLRAMVAMRSEFGLPVGYSDHTLGTAVALAAVARGAVVIEKHFTLDRQLPGPDHRASLEPAELARLVHEIREVEIALGREAKGPTDAEIGNRALARRSLVAAAPINRGEKFTTRNLSIKRPGTGVSPLLYWDYLGRSASRDYQPDEAIEP